MPQNSQVGGHAHGFTEPPDFRQIRAVTAELNLADEILAPAKSSAYVYLAHPRFLPQLPQQGPQFPSLNCQ